MKTQKSTCKTLPRSRAGLRAGTFVGLLAVCVALASTQAQQQSVPDTVKRGEFLVRIGDCNGCHTPWVMGGQGFAPDMSRMLSGHPQDMVMPTPPDLGNSPWGWVGAMTITAFAGP